MIILFFINLLCCIVSVLLQFIHTNGYLPTTLPFLHSRRRHDCSDIVIANGTHVLYPSNTLMPCCKNSFGVVSLMISYISFYHGLCLLPSKPRSTIQDVIIHLFRVLLETNIFPCLLLALYIHVIWHEYDTLILVLYIGSLPPPPPFFCPPPLIPHELAPSSPDVLRSVDSISASCLFVSKFIWLFCISI